MTASAATPAPVEPTEVIHEPDGGFTEHYDIPLRAGTWKFRPEKVLRLEQMRERAPGELGTLLALCKDVFVDHWHEIHFGICIQGAVYELELARGPEGFSMLDGYLTVGMASGPAHFHLCIEATRGLGRSKTPEAWAQIRPCRRAVFYRTLRSDGCSPASWGIRMWNGTGEQMLTVFLPTPFLSHAGKRLRPPDWTRLSLWNELRARYLGEGVPQPIPEDCEPPGSHA